VRRLSISAFLFAVLALGCFFVFRSSGNRTVNAESLRPASQRKLAPDFALKDADGRTVHLSDYRGKVVLLDFWATWCGPCRMEIPWFIEMQRDNRDRGFEVLGVSMDDNGWEDVKPFLAEMKVNYRILIGDDRTAEVYGGVESLPTTFLIDREGRIAVVHVGLTSRRDIQDGVEQLLRSDPKVALDRDLVSALSLRPR
jgi:cytochrome c biogenesis protein CcmG/thiol:disulfide interchange protein DsbE